LKTKGRIKSTGRQGEGSVDVCLEGGGVDGQLMTVGGDWEHCAALFYSCKFCEDQIRGRAIATGERDDDGGWWW
jgi:hypothetical protein